MDEKELYKKAISHYSKQCGTDIANDHTAKYADELIFCYIQEKSLIDFDFWTQYEELLGEKISYKEYLFLDDRFDGDPNDLTIGDSYDEAEILSLRSCLHEFRNEHQIVGSLMIHSLSTITENKDGIREFYESDVNLDADAVKDAFKTACAINPHILRNGVFSESEKHIESQYLDGFGFSRLELSQKKVDLTKANLKNLLLGVDKEILKEVLSEAVKEDALQLFYECEVPQRIKALTGDTLTKTEATLLISNLLSDDRAGLDWESFDQSLLKCYQEFLSDKTWITVYKDTLGYYKGIDNLTEILVPTAWLKEQLRKEGEHNLDTWLSAYTADNTDVIAYKALEDGIIIACLDEEISIMQGKDSLEHSKLGLDAHIHKAKEQQEQSHKEHIEGRVYFER